jgi:hypothetical protein
MDQLYAEGAQYLASDYTSFESQWSPEAMQNTYMPFYRRALKDLPEGEFVLQVFARYIMGLNTCCFKSSQFKMTMLGKRMSVEVDTSLANGLGNYVLAHFVCVVLCGWSERDFEACVKVEGDDLLCRILGRPPTKEMFASLGFDIKPEIHDDLSEASFCGEVFDTVARDIVPNVMETLVQFGWAPSTYCGQRSIKRVMLARMKALSLAHQYPGAPVLGAFARYVLRTTRHVRLLDKFVEERRELSEWDRSQFAAAIAASDVSTKDVHIRTRLLVERTQGLEVQLQLALEKYFDSLQSAQDLRHDLFSTVVGDINLHFSAIHVFECAPNTLSRTDLEPLFPYRDLELPAETTTTDLLRLLGQPEFGAVPGWQAAG